VQKKVKVEIYEEDPFTGCCGPGIASKDSIERTRKMLTERNEAVKRLREEFKEQIEIESEIATSRRRYDTYPPHAQKFLSARTQVPFILLDGQLVSEGAFPTLEELRRIIEEHIKSSQHKSQVNKEVIA
jgi:hypothetical protein